MSSLATTRKVMHKAAFPASSMVKRRARITQVMKATGEAVSAFQLLQTYVAPVATILTLASVVGNIFVTVQVLNKLKGEIKTEIKGEIKAIKDDLDIRLTGVVVMSLLCVLATLAVALVK